MFNLERDFILQGPGFAAVDAAKQSMESAQKDVYESHRHRVFAVAFYMTGNELEAEEILTKTFTQAFVQHEKPCAFEIDSALISELKSRFDLSGELPAPVSPDINLGGRNVLRPELEAAIESLPARERLVFLLKDVEAYSTETISALLGLPCSEVQRALLSAHLRLCRRLAASGASSEAA